MGRFFLSWKSFFIIVAILIVLASIFFSNYLSKKIAALEKLKIEQWVEAVKEVNNVNSNPSILNTKILTENNKDIPLIVVTEKDTILDYKNIDSQKVAANKDYIYQALNEFKLTNPPIVWQNPLDSTQNNLVYYGESTLLKEIRYFPIVQLFVMALFIGIILYSVSIQNKSTQNQVWAGMAKETAHQLGTPLSSLQGWVEILKEEPQNQKIASEISKDVERLKLVSDRFGKIGSKPTLEETAIIPQLQSMIDYIKRRASDKLIFKLEANENVLAMVNPPLFDWVIENLLKNALDAMDETGMITVTITNETAKIFIDVKDSGKGILKKNFTTIFNPGFTTKKRGWGLGLSLSKRIIEQYHSGELYVKHSETNKGTTFSHCIKQVSF